MNEWWALAWLALVIAVLAYANLAVEVKVRRFMQRKCVEPTCYEKGTHLHDGAPVCSKHACPECEVKR